MTKNTTPDKKTKDTLNAVPSEVEIVPPRIIQRQSTQEMQIQTNSAIVLATLPHISEKTSGEIIKAIDKENERIYKLKIREQNFRNWIRILIILIVAALLFFLITREYFNLITSLIPLIATGFGGVGIGVIFMYNKLRLKIKK